jgi:predicted anti-sigma-YlaC factor YlaD
MTTDCPREQIAAWVDRQLEAEEAAQVELHLQQCESCRQFRAELELTTRMFRDLEVLEPPAYLWTRIAAELEQPARRERFAWLRWPEGWLLHKRESLALAAALFLIIGGSIFFVLERQASMHSRLATIAQIDSYHAALLAEKPDVYNPFRRSNWADSDSNPFARHQLKEDSNPFGSLRGKR